MKTKYFEDTETMLIEFSKIFISPVILGKKEKSARF